MGDNLGAPTTAPGAVGPQQTGGGVHRLHNMIVEEVSPVDHPANTRRFLMIKRDRNMAQKLVPSAAGGYRTQTVQKNPPPPPPPVQTTEAGADALPAGGGDQTQPQMSMPGAVKQEMTEVLSALQAKIGEMLAAVQAATESADGTVPPELLADMSAMSELLTRASAKYSGQQMPPSAPPAPAAEGGMEPKRAPALKNGDAVISRARFAGLLKTFELWDAFLEKLAPIVELRQRAAGSAGAGAAATGEATPAPTTTTKRAPAAAGRTEIEKLVEINERALERIERLEHENVQLRKAVIPSNSAPSDAGKERRRPVSKSWGMDFNRPLTPENVPDEESFFTAKDFE